MQRELNDPSHDSRPEGSHNPGPAAAHPHRGAGSTVYREAALNGDGSGGPHHSGDGITNAHAQESETATDDISHAGVAGDAGEADQRNLAEPTGRTEPDASYAFPTEPGYYDVAPRYLDPRPFSVRTLSSTEEADEDLRASIKRWGILEPIIVVLRNGRGRIVIGQRRNAEALNLEFEKVPIKLMEWTDAQAREAAEDENGSWLPGSPWDHVLTIRRILAIEPAATVEDVKRAKRYSTGKAWKFRQIAGAIDEQVVSAAHVTNEDLCLLQVQELHRIARVPDRDARAALLKAAVVSAVARAKNADSSEEDGPTAPAQRGGGPVAEPFQHASCLRSFNNGRHTLGVTPALVNDETIGRVVEDLAAFVKRIHPSLDELAGTIARWAKQPESDEEPWAA